MRFDLSRSSTNRHSWRQRSNVSPRHYANNHITAGNGYTYDAAGNIASFNDGAAHTYNYIYDAEGRMLSVSGAASASYVYDATGLRVQTTVSGSVVDFAYDLAGREVVKYTPTVFRRLEVYRPDNGRHLVTYVNGGYERLRQSAKP